MWGKELFTLLFGNPSDSLLFEEVDSVYMQALQPASPAELTDPEACLQFCVKMMEALFDAEISKRLAIGSYASAVQQPQHVEVATLVDLPGVRGRVPEAQ